MRILLLHNPKAGDQEHEGEELVEALEKAGHEPIYQSLKKKDFKKALEEKIDLVLTAGGDGAVAKVARQLMGTKTPLSILPLGTANNVARMLGFSGPANKLIANLEKGVPHSFDVGIARGPWGKRYFFEGTGAGLFADYLESPKKKSVPVEPISKSEQMKRHVVELRRELQDYRARPWKIILDDEDCSGRYLLWQAMNIRSVGPVLKLAPNAKSDDGQLDFVGAREEEREKLLNYLDARLAGVKSKLPLQPKKFTRMQILWKKSPMHFDDKIWPGEDDKKVDESKIEIGVKSAALQIWCITK